MRKQFFSQISSKLAAGNLHFIRIKLKMKIITFILTLVFFSVSLSAVSKDSVKKNISINALRTQEKIIIDGQLSENTWKLAQKVSDFTQQDPLEGTDPTEITEVFIAYDDNALYVAAMLKDSSPDSITARLSRRDVETNDDIFAIFLDPDYDRRSGYYFGVSAAGTQYDGVLYNDRWDDNSWDAVWESGVNINGDGWYCELKIPFSQMRFSENENHVWGVNLRRDISRKNEIDYLVYIPKNEHVFVSRFYDLEGIENIKASGSIELLPYALSKAEYLQHSQGDPFNDGSKYSTGFGSDMKMSLGSNLKLNATINPDFGQVEIDPAVINLSDVETFFSEKRPFFTEGSTIFNFGQGGATNYWGFNWNNPQFFYSRRIGRVPQGSVPDADYTDVPVGAHILGAAKLTGKISEGWSIGTIQALTSKEMAELQTNGERSKVEIEPLTYYGVLRTQKELNEGRQGIGGIATYTSRYFDEDRLRNEINKNALTFGIDGWTFLDSSNTWVFAGAMGYSHITGTKERLIDLQTNSQHYFQRPDAKTIRLDSNATFLDGTAGRFVINKEKGNFFFNSAFGFVSPGFDINDVGFLYRADVLNTHIGAGYFWNEPTDTYRYLELGGALFGNWDYDGNRTGGGIFHFASLQFLNFYWINWQLGFYNQSISNRLTRGGPIVLNPNGIEYNITMNSDQRKAWNFSLGLFSGGKLDYPFYWQIEAGIEFRPAPNISFSISPFLFRDNEFSQWVDAFDDPTATNTFGKRYVFAELLQHTFGAGIRLNWTFTPKLSLQFYLQPLISSGDYRNFKELAKPRTYDFNNYNIDEATANQEEFFVDPDGSGPSQGFVVSNPDFNFKSLRGNAVLRWEYLPGSSLYFVWTQTRSDSENIGEFRLKQSFNRLLDAHPDNIFIIKFAYWFNL
jgi:hypothetical protein